MKTKIKAEVVGDSLSPQGNRITSLVLTYPRIIHSEFLTHRLFSRNAASSRAIPTRKMIEILENDPFIPIAFQKEHKGMQGYEYITDPVEIQKEIDDWLDDRDYLVKKAKGRIERKVTKQLINRPLEAFQYYTTLVTATEWENFFSLRCPIYHIKEIDSRDEIVFDKKYRSRKDLIADGFTHFKGIPVEELKETDWLQLNSGQAEIHMMALAEAIWDAMNESKPRQLQAGEWHIPFKDKIDASQMDRQLGWLDLIEEPENADLLFEDWLLTNTIKVSTAMAARTSYTVVGDEKEITYEKLLEIYEDKLLPKPNEPFHASPFEHCAKAMSDTEYYSSVKGQYFHGKFEDDNSVGWCRNYRGFIQYRHILENKL